MAKTIIAALVFIGHSKQSAIPIAMAYIFLNEPAISVPIKSLVSFKRNVSLQKTFFTNFVASAFLLEISTQIVFGEINFTALYKTSLIQLLGTTKNIIRVFFTAVSKSVIAVIFFDKLMPGKYFLFS